MFKLTSNRNYILNSSNLILILISVLNILSLVILFYFKMNCFITDSTYYFTYSIILSFSLIIVSAKNLPAQVFDKRKKMLSTLLLTSVLILLSASLWNTYPEEWYSGLIVGIYGLAVMLIAYVLKWKKEKKHID